MYLYLVKTSTCTVRKYPKDKTLMIKNLNMFAYRKRNMEITHDPFLFSVAQGIFWLSSERLSRSTLHLIEGEEWSLYSYSVVLHQTPCEDSDKISESRTSSNILHLSACR